MPDSTSARPLAPSDPFARISSEDLRSAARQVLAGLSPDVGRDGPELAARLAGLAARVEAARSAEPAPPPAGGPSDEALLDLLFAAAVTARFRDGVAPPLPELLSLLRSFGAVRGSLPAGSGPTPVIPFDDPAVVVGLAHDLRSPLTSVLFLSDSLRSGQAGDLNETQRRQLGIIYSATLGLISMANDILDLYRRGDQLVDDRPTPFSIREVVGAIREVVLPIAEERRIDLRFSLPDDDLRTGHPVALARVLLNLTVNGLKYTDSGFVEVAALSTGSTGVEFSVRDSGAGIRPEEEADLFQPVRRVSHWNGPGFSGTGLGLALARHLVRAMGSDLAYETEPGTGSRFYFELDLPPSLPA